MKNKILIVVASDTEARKIHAVDPDVLVIGYLEALRKDGSNDIRPEFPNAALELMRAIEANRPSILAGILTEELHKNWQGAAIYVHQKYPTLPIFAACLEEKGSEMIALAIYRLGSGISCEKLKCLKKEKLWNFLITFLKSETAKSAHA